MKISCFKPKIMASGGTAGGEEGIVIAGIKNSGKKVLTKILSFDILYMQREGPAFSLFLPSFKTSRLAS